MSVNLYFTTPSYNIKHQPFARFPNVSYSLLEFQNLICILINFMTFNEVFVELTTK